MSRIVYLGFPSGKIAGGIKMTLRHVEELCRLGFDAVFWTNHGELAPSWFRHAAPVEFGTPFRKDDILVVPEDAPKAMDLVAGMPQRSFVFCQNHFFFSVYGYDCFSRHLSSGFEGVIACSQTAASSVTRAFPTVSVQFIPCFIDADTFRPCTPRRQAVAYMPRKRFNEARAIQGFFKRYYPEHAGLPWVAIEGLTETEVARCLSESTVFLSLARLEALGMSALEAMACGCVVAGFTGLGGWEFASHDNGFWVAEDDCEAAADAIAKAVDLVRNGGAALQRYAEAARETVRIWSSETFRLRLEEVWGRLAPDARL